MIITLLLKHYQKILWAVAVVALLAQAYAWSYQRGARATAAVYEAKIVAQQQLLDTKVANLERLSTELIIKQSTTQTTLRNDLAKILVAAKTKPLVVYKNGECNPSQTFLDSWNEIILQGNKK